MPCRLHKLQIFSPLCQLPLVLVQRLLNFKQSCVGFISCAVGIFSKKILPGSMSCRFPNDFLYFDGVRSHIEILIHF